MLFDHNSREDAIIDLTTLIKSSFRRVVELSARFGFSAHSGVTKGPSHSYRVRKPEAVTSPRPRIVHALANFMTGGSSRLVVDLIEHLGHVYEQEVITYFSPDPPHYTNLTLHEFGDADAVAPILSYFREYRPELVHIHYWGDTDRPWYELVFSAAEMYGCKIVENVNTPVSPFFSQSIDRYIFVSDYVRTSFGNGLASEVTIYPGSNFRMFYRRESSPVPDDCVGMVYRLEKDKLDERAIDVFVKIARRRPGTKVIIVGGGTFLKQYRRQVRRHKLEDSFIFTGYVPYEDLPALYERMAVFIAPVWKESFGQVSPFAMSMGIPVIGYDAGALEEIVDDPSLLAPPGDSDRLAEIAVALLDDRERRLAIGGRNRERSNRLFSVEAMVQSYEKLYLDVLEGCR